MQRKDSFFSLQFRVQVTSASQSCEKSTTDGADEKGHTDYTDEILTTNGADKGEKMPAQQSGAGIEWIVCQERRLLFFVQIVEVKVK